MTTWRVKRRQTSSVCISQAPSPVNRSFGGAQVSRTFYARGQTGQQLLLGAYSALNAQVAAGNVVVYPRTEMLDLIVVDGVAKVSQSYSGSLSDGEVGLATWKAIARFDDVSVQPYEPPPPPPSTTVPPPTTASEES